MSFAWIEKILTIHNSNQFHPHTDIPFRRQTNIHERYLQQIVLSTAYHLKTKRISKYFHRIFVKNIFKLKVKPSLVENSTCRAFSL